jgi:thioredoxin 1
MTNVIHVDDSNFQSVVIDSTVPVLVEFGAAWCGPCAKQLPILEDFASQYSEKVKVVKIDIDDSPGLTNKFLIRSVPTLITFNKGSVTDTKSGLTSLVELKANFLSRFGI